MGWILSARALRWAIQSSWTNGSRSGVLLRPTEPPNWLFREFRYCPFRERDQACVEPVEVSLQPPAYFDVGLLEAIQYVNYEDIDLSKLATVIP